MVVFLRKNLVLAMMALVLLAGPVGWITQASTMPTVHTYQSVSRDVRCPPPPYEC